MTNPTSTLKHRTALLIALAILNVVVIGVMQSFGVFLKPFSIIGFEFAWTPQQAHLIVNTWRENGVLDSVFFLTGFDYLFMVTYSAFLWTACLLSAEGLPDKISKALIVLAWMQPFAALLDAVENLALYQMISGSWSSVWPTVAALCAAPKFVIVVSGVVVCLAITVYKISGKSAHQNVIAP